MIDAAIQAMDRGWAVLPVNGKIPATPNGVKDASSEHRLTSIWFERYPDRGLALATGAPSGVWVLDVDGEDGISALTSLQETHGRLPTTIMSCTARGYHLLFQMPDGRDIRNSASKLAPGVDVRGTGGYIVLPPSPHPGGEAYRWAVGRSPDELAIGDAPPWLLELVTSTGAQNGQYRPAALLRDSIPAGARNQTLASLAGTMRRRGASEAALCAALSEENRTRCSPPLADDEVGSIAASVGRYEPGPAARSESGGEAPTLTDTGNATRLVDLHGAGMRHIAPWGKWLVWDVGAGLWIKDHGDVRVRELAKDVGRQLKGEAAEESDDAHAKALFKWGQRSLNHRPIGAMVDLSRGIDGIPLNHQDLDADAWLLGVGNGVIDLRTGRLRDADPADLMTRQAASSWDETASAPRWEQAVEEWFPDPDVRSYVQRVAGSALVGAQHDHVLIVHYGMGRNGKGTFTRALQRVLGPYAVVIHLSLLVETRRQEHDTVKANLFRARLAVASETQRRVKLDEASVKNLTGGDRITARRMREDPWEFDPTHSLWLQTNHLPEIGGRDTGIWSRLSVVKWESTFEGKRADPHLDEALAAEAAGILRWLVVGCLEWQEHGLDEPEAVIRETLAYRTAEDTLGRFAADVGLVFRADLEIQASELQELLRTWADEEGTTTPKGMTDWLTEHGCRRKQRTVHGPEGTTRRPKFWLSVGLDDDSHRITQADAFN